MKDGDKSDVSKSAPKKVQRIKMRQHERPVKLDGSVVEYAPDGSWFTVEFDGPLPDMKFWSYGKGPGPLVVDREPLKRSDGSHYPADDTQFWEVL